MKKNTYCAIVRERTTGEYTAIFDYTTPEAFRDDIDRNGYDLLNMTACTATVSGCFADFGRAYVFPDFDTYEALTTADGPFIDDMVNAILYDDDPVLCVVVNVKHSGLMIDKMAPVQYRSRAGRVNSFRRAVDKLFPGLSVRIVDNGDYRRLNVDNVDGDRISTGIDLEGRYGFLNVSGGFRSPD